MGEAKIYTFSIIYSSTAQHAHLVPYIAAILEHEDGRRFPALLGSYTEGQDVRIGQTVKYAGENKMGEEK